MPEVVFSMNSPATMTVSKCWNSIYLTLSKTQKRYEELKAQNPNITILIEEVGPKLKERFFELIELIILENRQLNCETNGKYDELSERRLSAVEWKYGEKTEYFMRNDLLGTIVAYSAGNDMPRDLVDEVAYMIASFAHALPPSFLVHESIIRPVSRFFDILISKPSKYSVVLCGKIFDRIEEYPPLWQLLTLNEENSFGRLLSFLLSIPDAFKHVLQLFSRLIKLDETVEFCLFDSLNILSIIDGRIVQDFDLVLGSVWTEDQVKLFLETVKHLDLFIVDLSDEGKCRIAQNIKQNFVNEHLNPALRQLKLFDGTVVRSIEFLASLFKTIDSVEICLPIGHCFKQFFFNESDSETDCLNLMRLLFTEGEMQLSLAVIRMLQSLLENKSRSLLAIFSYETDKGAVFSCKYNQHKQLCDRLMNLVESLPEQMHDKNVENVNQLYRSHIIHAESLVPESIELLNALKSDKSAILSSLFIKIFDAFTQGFWRRTPTENLVFIRFAMTALYACDMLFCYNELLGTSNQVLSLLNAGSHLLAETLTDPIKQHIEMQDTTRSIARFRANLYQIVHGGDAESEDMFDVSGILDKLVTDIDAKTVGALSANVLLFHCFYMRILAIIQVQSTRNFKTIIYS